MPEINLTKGYSTIVSIEDYEWLMQWPWHSRIIHHQRRDYVCATRNGPTGTRTTITMSRAIVERMTGGPIPEGHEVDHINGDPLDNRRANLRIATKGQNAQNRKARLRESGIRGVSYHRSSGKWRAGITNSDGFVSLGMYDTEEQAAAVYDLAARYYYGEHAETNFAPDDERTLRVSFPEWYNAHREVLRGRSAHRGVNWHKSSMKWRARIHANGVEHSLGLYDSEIEAARAVNRAILRLGLKKPLNQVD
jgi:hypothetical protein